MLQSVVGDHRVAQQQAPQFLQPGKPRHARVAEWAVAQIEAAEFRERGETEVSDAALRATEIFHLGQPEQVLQPRVANIDLGGEMPAEVEFLELLESRERLEHIVRILVAAARIPDRAWEIEFAQ